MPTRHGSYEIELKIDSTTERFRLMKQDDGTSMYEIATLPFKVRDPLTYTQTSWLGGHGQYEYNQDVKNDMYFDGQSIDSSIEGSLFLGPLITTVQESDDTDLDSAPLGFAWNQTNSQWLCWTTDKIYRYDITSSGKWHVATTSVSGVNSMIEYDGIMYAAVGATTLMYYSSDTDTWTQTDLSGGKADYLLVSPNSAGTQDVLWIGRKPNELSNTTDGRTSATGGVAYESPTYVGDTSNNITNIFLHSDMLLVGKEDGLWLLDADGGIHQFREDLKVNRSTDNFKYVAHWSAATYFSEINGMGELYSRNEYEPMGPLTKAGQGAIGNIGKRGNIVGLTSDKDFVYVAIDEGTNTHIYKGREVRRYEQLRWEWCPWVFLGTNACSAIKICQHSATVKKLWFGYGNATGFVLVSDNPLADSGATFCTSGHLLMSYDYGSNPNYEMMWQSAVIEAQRVNLGGITISGSGETLQVKYRDDADVSATSIISAYNTLGIVETNFTTAINNKRVQFQIDLASDTSTATPVVSKFQVKGVERPTVVRTHNMVLKAMDGNQNKAKTLRNLLRTSRSSTTLLRLADLRYNMSTAGTASTDYYNCVVEPGYPLEREIVHKADGSIELGIELKLREVSFS